MMIDRIRDEEVWTRNAYNSSKKFNFEQRAREGENSSSRAGVFRDAIFLKLNDI